jgi:hypothetical protein
VVVVPPPRPHLAEPLTIAGRFAAQRLPVEHPGPHDLLGTATGCFRG